jgi:hypothetical protein
MKGPVGLSAIRRAARRPVVIKPAPRAPWWLKALGELVAALVILAFAYSVVSDREDRMVVAAWAEGSAFGQSTCGGGK